MKPIGVSLVVGSVLTLFTTYVIQSLWNWFATSAFHLTELSYWATYGLVLLISLFSDSLGNSAADEIRYKTTAIMLNACVPDGKREEVVEKLGGKDGERFVYGEMFKQAMHRIMMNAVALSTGGRIIALSRTHAGPVPPFRRVSTDPALQLSSQ